jgi:hypothetical protein
LNLSGGISGKRLLKHVVSYLWRYDLKHSYRYVGVDVLSVHLSYSVGFRVELLKQFSEVVDMDVFCMHVSKRKET